MHTFLLIALIAWYVRGIVATVVNVGKPREPLSPETAAVWVLAYLLLICAVMALA